MAYMSYGNPYHTDNKLIGYTITGGIVGLSAGLILREVVDPAVANPFLSGATSTPPMGVKTLGNFGSPSFLGSAIGGAIALGLGIEGATSGRIIKSRDATGFALGAGSTLAANAVYSAVMPNTAWANLVAKDPSNPITTKISIAPRPSGAPLSSAQLAQNLIT
jgi:hypothetical protein